MKAPREVAVTKIYTKNRKSQARYVVNRGGARSSKSYSIAQLLVEKFTAEKKKNFLITRKTFPSLRITSYKLITDLMGDYGYLPAYYQHNKTSHSITNPYKNNWMLFTSIDDPEKIKSTEWNYIWPEETTEFTYEDFQIMQLRLSGPTQKEPNQIFFSFNPVNAFHWLKTDLVDKRSQNVQEIVSTYRDNPFLSEEYIEILLELRRTDPTYWDIYGLGKWGTIEGLIYKNWDTLSCDLWPECEVKIYGLDFGFNNQTALIEENLTDGEVYERQLLYESGLTNNKLIERLEDLIPDKSSYIFADNAEPARIQEIVEAGFNCWASDKRVKDGIDFVKRLKIHIDPNSVDVINESRSYKWKKKKVLAITDAGRESVIVDDDEPLKFRDHLMDARRYAIYTWHSMITKDDLESYGIGETESSKADW